MELVSVLLVHRHGARLPTNPMGNDLLWPQDDSFWKQYKGTISPIGMNQSRNLGEQIRKKYIHLYDGMTPREISDRTTCHSSNINRTIMSAWSFYNGFFPDIPVHLRYLSDRESNDYIETEEQLNKKDMTLGIGIIIEKIKSLDKLFHMGKKDEDLKLWRKENIKKSTFVKEALQNEKDYLNLFDKIFKITQCEKFSPSRSFIDRLSSLKFIYTNIKITECHGFSVIPNTLGLELTQEEYRMISYATKQICNLQFRPYHNLVAYDRGIKTAGYISNEIARYFREIINGRNNNIFTSFSGHDTTLLALASSLGIYLNNPPYFTGYFLFELYKNENSEYFVKVYYNYDPTKIGIEELKPRIWKKVKYYTKWDSMEEGVFTFQEFSLLFSQSEFERVNLFLRQFSKGHKIEKSNKVDYITHTSRNRYKMVFRCYDRDDNGFITVDELKEILLKLHEVHITDEDIQKLIEYYDTNKDGLLDSNEFINMVANFIY
jgi:hypothetical protein